MTKFSFSFKSMQALLLALLMVPFFSTCKDKDNPEPPKSNETVMTNVLVTAGTEFYPTLQADGKTWKFWVDYGFNMDLLKSATVTFKLSDGATSTPASPANNVDLTSPKNFTVTAEDGSTTFVYTIAMEVGESSEAKMITFSLYVGGENVAGVIDNDHSTVSFDILQEFWDDLDGLVPTFTVSPGATANPAMDAPQDFRDEVTYEVTAQAGNKRTWTVTCTEIIPEVTGFTDAEAGATKTFVDLGYPGELNNWDIDAILFGDLLMYHAYCGDYIVLVSRVYIETDPTSPHCIKVVDKTTLEPAGTLNLGSIDISNLRMVTSDYKGQCVAAVSNDSETEFFYWKTPTDAPVSVGKMGVDIRATTASSLVWNSGAGMDNFQVAGDITGNAWITAYAPPSTEGKHFRIKVTGGQLASSYSTVTTGYSSDDATKFQMISPLDASDEPSFVVGDTEGSGPGSVRCYINNWAGATTSVMLPFWNENAPNAIPDIVGVDDYYAGTGIVTSRTGSRRPVVTALPINGKTYVAVTSGTPFWPSLAVLNDDLKSWPDPVLTQSFPINSGWAFGSWIDWYYNEELKEAYLSVWHGRYGLLTYKMTCE